MSVCGGVLVYRHAVLEHSQFVQFKRDVQRPQSGQTMPDQNATDVFSPGTACLDSSAALDARG